MKMRYNIWVTPREAFCWLNQTKVIVRSSKSSNAQLQMAMGHCELVDTVSKLDKNLCNIV